MRVGGGGRATGLFPLLASERCPAEFGQQALAIRSLPRVLCVPWAMFPRGRLYSSVVERQSCKLKVLGSIPSGGSIAFRLLFQVCRSALKGVNPTCCSGGLPASGPSPVSRHCVRVAKEMDSKSIGLCPQGFESPRCRFAAAVRVRHPFISCSLGPSLPGWCPSKLLAQSVVVDGKAYSRRDSSPQSPP